MSTTGTSEAARRRPRQRPADRGHHHLHCHLHCQLRHTIPAAAARAHARYGGHPDRVDDASPTTSASSTAVTLGLADHLPPGVYVVMWDVLAVDAHSTSGHRLLFVAAPTE